MEEVDEVLRNREAEAREIGGKKEKTTSEKTTETCLRGKE